MVKVFGDHIKEIVKTQSIINKMKKYPLNKIKKIEKIGTVITVTYDDDTKFQLEDDVVFEKDLINENDQPLVDHCI